jgi:hypothetical protein
MQATLAKENKSFRRWLPIKRRFFMAKKIIFILFLSLWVSAIAEAQKNTRPRPATKKPIVTKKPSVKASPATAATTTAPVIGSAVNIITKGGDKLSGQLLDMSAYSVRIRSDNLESAIPMESITSISFGAAKGSEPNEKPLSENFTREANVTLIAFQTMTNETKTGSDYTDYGRQLAELRRTTDRFIQKYSTSANPTETRCVSLFSGAITDYTWARTIWTLKLGSDGFVSESEAPVIADTLTLYPDLRTATANGNRFSADKLVGSLWKKASEKAERARSLLTQ